MPANTATETVTLDRQAVLDLLVEANKIVDVIEAITGTCPTCLTEPLVEKATVIGEAVLGEDGVRALWTGDGAREFFRQLAGDYNTRLEDAPPVIQALAASLEEGENDG